MTNFISTPQIRMGKAGSQYIAADPGDICYSFCTSKPGWLLCDGSEYLVSDYPDLFAVIGYMFVPTDDPDADGNHFRVPNCSGKFLQMVSAGAAVGDMKDAGLPNITGSQETGHSLGLFGPEGTGAFRKHSSYGGSVAGASGSYSKGFTFDASLSNPIYGNSTTVQPPSMLVNYFIKY